MRLHEGSIDPLLGQDLAVTQIQRRRDSSLLMRMLLPVIAGFSVGWVIDSVAPAETTAWRYIGGVAGAVVAVGLVLFGSGNRIEALQKAAADAAKRGEVVLSLAFDAGEDARVRRRLRAEGGTVLGVIA